MADRRWTVMVVPHGSDSPRSFSISERAVRAAAYTGSMLGLIALVGLGSAIASVGRTVSRIVRPAEANAMSQSAPRDVSEVARRVASLRDTLDTSATAAGGVMSGEDPSRGVRYGAGNGHVGGDRESRPGE